MSIDQGMDKEDVMCVCISISKKNIYIYIHTHDIFFIHSLVNGHLGCFHVLAIVLINSATVNTGVHVYFQIVVFLQTYAQEWGHCIIW